MNWAEVRGHSEQIQMFRRAVARGRVAHAYLFVGPAGIGKRLIALQIAKCLFCLRHDDEELLACGECSACRQVHAGTHPDLLLVQRPPGKRDLPIDLFVGEGDRRGREGLCRELAMRPMSATRRIAIIDDADTMNEASANALLKTLEEPPPGSILFLITPSTDAVLPTIRSRCQPLLFSRLPESDIAELLQTLELETNPDAARETARLSDGSLETARQLLVPELRELRQQVHRALADRRFDPVATASRCLAALEEIGGGTAGQRENAAWLIRFAIDHFRQQLESETPPGDETTAERQAAAIDECLGAQRHLDQSMPVPLCLESLFDRISRALRGAIPAW